jgi:hypothetical protein
MTLIIEKPTTSKLILAKDYVGIDDPDAEAYIAAVEAADEAESPGVGALETATKVAIHSFVKGCKNDGIWPAIKSSCILAGARTLAGALVPLAGPAPTNVSDLFVAGDYDRKTGLKGDGTTKYLNTNRTNQSDPYANKHLAVYQTETETRDGTRGAIGIGSNCELITTATSRFFRVNDTDAAFAGSSTFAAGTWGVERSSVSSKSYFYNGSLTAITSTQSVTVNGDVLVFTRSTGGNRSDGRIAFYSIGTSLSLTALNTRWTTLYNAIGAAIP